MQKRLSLGNNEKAFTICLYEETDLQKGFLLCFFEKSNQILFLNINLICGVDENRFFSKVFFFIEFSSEFAPKSSRTEECLLAQGREG